VPPIHRERNQGEGVRVAMIDTGFDHSHPWFTRNNFTSSVVLAASATNRDTDPGSHGTGESANVFAVAPKVTFIGVKLGDDADPYGGASILEGFQEALKHNPHIITVSMCYDLRDVDGRSELRELPNGLKPLEAEIQAAIAAGIVVVFSSGNGHYAFPASMPEVLSVGGTYVAEDGSMRASDYASAFTSQIYSGRHVPDVCGLVGMLPYGDYIMLPVPPGFEIDTGNAQHDGTKPGDGWAVFSGTSASAPQIAGVCALLLQKNPRLTPAAVKALLTRTAVDVREGSANPASDPEGVGIKAGPGIDGATGAGLVDAFAAWLQA
jgi:subtilisin family serine protease